MKKSVFICGSLAMIFLLVLPALAQASTCYSITVTTTAVSFGNYNASAIASSGGVTATCTVLTGTALPSFTVALSAGNSGSFATRQMAFLTQKLNYNLYTTSGLTTVWGDGTGSSVPQSYTANGSTSSVTFTVYGNLPAKQFPTPGLYTDTLTVTVTF
jgi:spore coat protein U-like protein